MSLSRRAFTLGLGASSLVGSAEGADSKRRQPVEAADESKNSEAWQPKFFDPHQFETVAALSELIIPATDTPGAREAQVARYLDRILADSPEAARTAFLEGLWWADGYCLRLEGKPFKDLSDHQQTRIFLALFHSADPALETGRAFVRSMKDWTTKIYYSTEIGDRELNKNGHTPSTYAQSCGFEG